MIALMLQATLSNGGARLSKRRGYVDRAREAPAFQRVGRAKTKNPLLLESARMLPLEILGEWEDGTGRDETRETGRLVSVNAVGILT